MKSQKLKATSCFSIDASQTASMGRWINHGSAREANLKPVRLSAGGTYHVLFQATRGIRAGEELLWNYGDRRPEIQSSFPWLQDSASGDRQRRNPRVTQELPEVEVSRAEEKELALLQRRSQSSFSGARSAAAM